MTEKKDTPIKDQCPSWAEEMIEQLKQIEIFLGHIPKSLAWESNHLNDVVKRTFLKEEAVFDEHKSELVFQRITKGLLKENYTKEQIADFINRRIGYKGGPKYCDPSDIDSI